MTDFSISALAAAAVRPQDTGRFVLHQANAAFCDAVSRNLERSRSSVRQTIDEYGNSSAATVPLSPSWSVARSRFDGIEVPHHPLTTMPPSTK
ncbi:hypothetical protein NKI46_29810 [Mesorhizobium sp. M0615]|uniref:3-oxoacyl-[acyl-carrier-protein] synthase III C-terminal domain-containing protein n=1 Tax=Mesorhizobium sp. M0615 TaxID=2956971 RepID=UPI00333530CD